MAHVRVHPDASSSTAAEPRARRQSTAPPRRASQQKGAHYAVGNSVSLKKATALLGVDDEDELDRQHKAQLDKNSIRGTFMDENLQKRLANSYRGFRIYQTYEDVEESDMKRNLLLAQTRAISADLSPFSGFLPRNLVFTVLPHVAKAPAFWLSLIAFATCAALSRVGLIGYAASDYEDQALTGSSVLLSFLVAFFINHCYSRNLAIYGACMDCRNAVFDCCALATVYLYDERDVWRVWRYTNLAHVTAFVGLSPAYTKDNLFDRFVAESFLFEEEDSTERSLLDSMRIGDTGMRASQACISWAMSVVGEARRCKLIEKPEGVTLTDKLLVLRTSIAALFHYQFQVIPYVYLHLISLVNTAYLISFAALKGLRFTPDEGFTYGLVFPAVSVLIFTVALVGLLAVGSVLANPLGAGSADFAILSFLRSCTANSRQVAAAEVAKEAKGKASSPPGARVAKFAEEQQEEG